MDDATKALLVLGSSSPCSSGTGCRSARSPFLPRSALWATGLVTTNEAVAGFGDPVVVFIATLFVVSEGIDSTGVTTWSGRWLLDRAGTARARILVAVCLLSAAADVADHPQRGDRRTVAPGRPARTAGPTVAHPAAHAGRVRGQRRRAADADEQPGQRDRLRGSARGGRGPVPVLLVRARRRAAVGRHRRHLRVARSATAAAPDARAHAARPRRHAETIETHYKLTDGFYRLRVRSRSDMIGRHRGRRRRGGVRRRPDRGGRVARGARGLERDRTTTTS